MKVYNNIFKFISSLKFGEFICWKSQIWSVSWKPKTILTKIFAKSNQKNVPKLRGIKQMHLAILYIDIFNQGIWVVEIERYDSKYTYNSISSINIIVYLIKSASSSMIWQSSSRGLKNWNVFVSKTC